MFTKLAIYDIFLSLEIDLSVFLVIKVFAVYGFSGDFFGIHPTLGIQSQ